VTGDDKFEGVIPNLIRRFHETQSEFVKTEIAKYAEVIRKGNIRLQ